MRFRPLAAIALGALATASSAAAAHAQSAADRINRHNGVDTGQIIAVTPLEITIHKNGVDAKVAVEDIESVYLAGEPDDLNSARTALQAGRVDDALRLLEGISADGISREEVAAEVEFQKLHAQALAAVGGRGDLAKATADARAFLTRRRASFHVPQTIELVGDLLMAAGDYPAARTEYAKLAKARAEYFKLRSALLVGRAWQAEGKHAEALAEFDKVLAASARSTLIDPLRLSATLDRAVSQAAAGQSQDAVAALGEIIRSSNPEDGAALARAYNALGDCYLQAGDAEGALYAFLHVDLLYNDSADAHAKALHELVKLWRNSGKDARAQDAAQELADKYPASRWAKQ
ncbi:MAG TPA: hypothetical protein VEQ85_08210 [Lacipirellulaceae bacterium]|nr:hypothetical protein [Lacipirellulaceae bacterium]